MQFNVPQFEIEDKIIGPFTAVQFLYIATMLVISFLLFPLLVTWLWFIISIILVGGSFALALVKIGGRPMSIFLLSAALYLWEPKIFIQPSEFTKITSLAPAHSLSSIKNNDLIEPAAPSIALSPIAPPSITSFSSSAKIVADIPAPVISTVPNTIIISSHSIEKLSPLREIFNKMMTHSSPISLRETSLMQSPTKKQSYEFIQKPTGETIVARRVDYR